MLAISPFCMSVCPPVQRFNQLTDLHEMWYGRHDIGGHPNLALFCCSLIGNNSGAHVRTS
jgi:hypothetical protein